MLFYDCSTAPSPRRARIFIADKGLDIETRDISIAKGAQLSDTFRAINPDATLPVLVTGSGLTLTENIAIAHYLEDMFPDPPLLGSGAEERAEILNWNAICETQGLWAVAEALRNANPHMKDRGLPGPDDHAQIPALAERGKRRAVRFFDRLDQHLEAADFIAAGRFSLADITAFVGVDFARVIKLRVDESRPHLKRWYDAMKARPSARL